MTSTPDFGGGGRYRHPQAWIDNVVESDPAQLLEKLRGTTRDGDVHLVGGPKTIETFRELGALDQLGIIVLPLFVGDGMRLTPAVSKDAKLALESQSALPNGAVEVTYSVG